jgi:hypothetical protein
MTFDIHQRIFEEGDYLEDEAIVYRQTLMEQFAASSEGQEYLAQTGDIGWADMFMDYAMRYLGVTPPDMTPAAVDEVLFDIFPRKVSAEPGSGEPIISELCAFWTFLQREYHLSNASSILKMLEAGLGSRLEEELQDPANFDMAKSFFMLGKSSGFDMTTQEGLNAFAQVYNAALQTSEPLPPSPLPGGLSTAGHPHRSAKTSAARRKMAAQSRRRNRKKR